MWILLLYAVESRIHRLAQHGIELPALPSSPAPAVRSLRDDQILFAEQVLWTSWARSRPDDHRIIGTCASAPSGRSILNSRSSRLRLIMGANNEFPGPAAALHRVHRPHCDPPGWLGM